MKDICVTYTYHRTITDMDEEASIGRLNLAVVDEVADHLMQVENFPPMPARQLTHYETAIANIVCWLSDLNGDVIRMEDKVLSVNPA